ncbi:MAG TPA: amidohydrolase [Acidimicrobiia bacterium]|jgi:amidohydrolase
MSTSEVVAAILPSVIDLRRAIHSHPELAHAESNTTALISTFLTQQGLSPELRKATGLTVMVGSGERLVGFRADLDALPIQEPDGLEFRSQVPGVMHACGHDIHASVAAGMAVAASRTELPGRIRFIFQPAEETFPGGAEDLVAEGMAEGLEAIVAFHVDPTLEPGRIGFRSGPITASADRLVIKLEGPGGHTARPHRSVDLVYATGKVITDLPAILDRTIDARLPAALVFGRVTSGSAFNVIPTSAEIAGTFRTLDHGLWAEAPVLIDRLLQEIVAPTGAKAFLDYQRGIPPVVNDEHVVAVLREAVGVALGVEAVAPTPTSMGGEDFANFTEKVPGALLRLGGQPSGLAADLHSASFRVDERAIETGIKGGLAGLVGLLQHGHQ